VTKLKGITNENNYDMKQ